MAVNFKKTIEIDEEEVETDLEDLFKLLTRPERIFTCDECGYLVKDCYCGDTCISDLRKSM